MFPLLNKLHVKFLTKHDANVILCGVFGGFISVYGKVIHINSFYSHMGTNSTQIKKFSTFVLLSISSPAPNCMCYPLSVACLISSIYIRPVETNASGVAKFKKALNEAAFVDGA